MREQWNNFWRVKDMEGLIGREIDRQQMREQWKFLKGKRCGSWIAK